MEPRAMKENTNVNTLAERKKVIIKANDEENYYLMTQDQIDVIRALVEDELIDEDNFEMTIIEELNWQVV